MQIPEFFSPFNTRSAIVKSRLLPVKTCINTYPVCCINCKFVNQAVYHFCTNCGYPVHPDKDKLALFGLRLNRRKAIEKSCTVRVLQARNALYVLAGILLLGLVYLFSNDAQTMIRGWVMPGLGVIYATLGRWSLSKPFTSLLIALMVILTFTAINTWSQFSKSGAGFAAFYMIFIEGIFIYFLWQGVKAAFHADILEEEFKM